MHKQITSPQNPFIKELVLLKEKSRNRKKSGLFLLEGFREIELALAGRFVPSKIVYCSDICNAEEVLTIENES